MLASIVARRVCRPAGARALTLYSTPGIPSPDIVRMYLEEVGKSDSVEQVKINVNKVSKISRAAGSPPKRRPITSDP